MIVCIGEIVWDIFNDKKVLGGAPLNVAYHLAQLEHEVIMVSRLGADELAGVTLREITALGLKTDFIQHDPELPTGRVMITINESNEPSFDIMEPAAWDAIDATETNQLAEQGEFHLVFGTLAQRNETSRETIRSFWHNAQTIFYDVNLRPPHTTKKLVLESIAAADVVKLNDAELDQVADWSQISPGDLQERAQKLASRHDLRALVVTRGGSGAFLVSGDWVYQHPGFPVEVVDTVGAGDAFFAALIDGVLSNRNWMECLKRANKRGAYVAGRPGATPKIE